MNEQIMGNIFSLTGNIGTDLAIFILMLLWVFFWKGRALWVAAKQNSVKWFMVLFVVQTAGILEILYIFIFSDKETKIENIDSGDINAQQ